MKRILSALILAIFLTAAFSCCAVAEMSFAEINDFTLVPCRAFDGLMEETAVDEPEITPGTWSASMSQPAITATLPGFDNRVTYTVVYTLRSGKRVDVPRQLQRKEWHTEVTLHRLIPIDACTGQWIEQTAEYIPYVTAPSRNDKNILSVGGKEIRVYYTAEIETEVGEPEWKGLVQETPVIERVYYTFNAPAEYDGLLLAINPEEVTRGSFFEEETEQPNGVFSDFDHLKEWEFISLRDSAFYETILPNTWGDEVNFLQQLLIRAGYQKPGTADGSYGPATIKAISALQEAAGIPVTGEADNRTIHALLDALN